MHFTEAKELIDEKRNRALSQNDLIWSLSGLWLHGLMSSPYTLFKPRSHKRENSRLQTVWRPPAEERLSPESCPGKNGVLGFPERGREGGCGGLNAPLIYGTIPPTRRPNIKPNSRKPKSQISVIPLRSKSRYSSAQNSRILIIMTPKQGTPTFGNSHVVDMW